MAIPRDQLPLVLPATDNFKLKGTPESPLSFIDSWVNTLDPAMAGMEKGDCFAVRKPS